MGGRDGTDAASLGREVGTRFGIGRREGRVG